MKPMIATFIVLTILFFALPGCMTSLGTINSTTYKATYDISLWRVERPEKATQRYGSQKVDTLAGSPKYKFSFEDDLVKILWLATSQTIAFSLENKTNHSIRIPWDEAAFVDENGRSHRVMHSGVKYTDKEKPQAPSIVVRKGILEDIVFPTSYVSYREGFYGRYVSSPGGWEEKSLLPDFDYRSDYTTGKYSTFSEFESTAKSYIGKTFQVLLPLQIEDVINDYIFTFRIENVSVAQESSSRNY